MKSPVITTWFGRLRESSGLLFGLVLLLALALRLTNLDATSLWLDEIYSLIVANMHIEQPILDFQVHPARYFYERSITWQPLHWPTLVALLKINVHMPLYYLLLNPWLSVFGPDAVGLRSFSVLFSVLMLLPVYGLGRALGGTRLGLLAAFAAAVSPYQIYFAQEGRMYALALFWCALSGLAFWKVLYSERPGRWGLFYAVAVAGGLLSHYMMVFYLGFHALFGVFWLIRHRDRRFGWLGLGVLAAAGIAWFWAPVYMAQQQGVEDTYHFAKGLEDWPRYLSVFVWQPLVTVAGDNKLVRLWYMPLTVLLLLFYAWLGRRMGESFSERREGFLLAWVLVPLALQVGYDFWKETHTAVIDRYILLISPGMILWLGLGLDRLLASGSYPRLAAALPGMMLVVALANVWHPSPFRDEHNKKDTRGKIAFFLEQSGERELVMVNGPYGAPNLAAYYIARHRPEQPMLYWVKEHRGQLYPLPDPSLVEGYERVWLFRLRATNERGLQDIKDLLQARYPVVRQERDWFIYSPATAP